MAANGVKVCMKLWHLKTSASLDRKSKVMIYS